VSKDCRVGAFRQAVGDMTSPTNGVRIAMGLPPP